MSRLQRHHGILAGLFLGLALTFLVPAVALAATKGKTSHVEKYSMRGNVSGLDHGHHVTIKLTGKLPRSVSTREDGSFEVRNLPPGTYTVRPVHSRYVFSPTFSTVAVTNHDKEVRGFKAMMKSSKRR